MSNLNIRELDPPTHLRQFDANCWKVRYVSEIKDAICSTSIFAWVMTLDHEPYDNFHHFYHHQILFCVCGRVFVCAMIFLPVITSPFFHYELINLHYLNLCCVLS